MNLFSKEKDLIHRIANLVLILWLVIAIFIFYTNMVDIIVKEPKLTYEEYKVEYCNDLYKPNDNLTEEESCKKMYDQNIVYEKTNDYYNKKGLINAAGNILIVGIFLFLLNRK